MRTPAADSRPAPFALLDRFAAEAAVQTRATYYSHIGFVAAEGYLLAGRPHEALGLARRSLTLAREHRERGFEALAERVLAEIVSGGEAAEFEAAVEHYGQAMAHGAELGMPPLVARCQLGLGRVLRRTGRREEARQTLHERLGPGGSARHAASLRECSRRVEGPGVNRQGRVAPTL